MPRESVDKDAKKRDNRTRLERRHFIGMTGGIGTAVLAGCLSQTDSLGTDEENGDPGEDGTDDAENEGTFRLLISDQPVAIDEFDSLDVSFDYARIFSEGAEDEEPEAGDDEGAEGDDDAEDEAADDDAEDSDDDAEDEGADDDAEDSDDDAEDEETDDDGEEAEEETDDEEPSEDTDSAEADEGEDDTEEVEEEADEDGGQRDFEIVDLEGSTVDLTQVVGDKAVSIFEGEFSEGSYTKIELHAADVDGIVDGESVSVKIPSGKLQIVKPFEVEAGETLSFVFDINVVKKGQTGEYNLLPVISESGVAGKDVAVEEVENEREDEEDDETEDEEGDATGDEEDEETEEEGDEAGDDEGEETEDDEGEETEDGETGDDEGEETENEEGDATEEE